MHSRQKETIGDERRVSWKCVPAILALAGILLSRAYPTMAAENQPTPDASAKAAVCGGCHGATGNSVVPNFPKLAGQQSEYLKKQLLDFKSGARTDAMMVGMVAGLSADDVSAVSGWFASQPLTAPPVDPPRNAKGETIYQRGDISRGIPPCAACHGTLGLGYPGFIPGGVPAVAGQHAAYTAKQLKAFRTGDRSNDKNGMMRQVATKLSDEEIDAVAAYLTGLEP